MTAVRRIVRTPSSGLNTPKRHADRAVTAVAWLAGGLIDLTDSAWHWTPGAALLTVGLAAATGIAIMQRKGTLNEDAIQGR